MITLVVDFHSSTTYLQSQKFLALVTTLKYFFQSVRKILLDPCTWTRLRLIYSLFCLIIIIPFAYKFHRQNITVNLGQSEWKHWLKLNDKTKKDEDITWNNFGIIIRKDLRLLNNIHLWVSVLVECNRSYKHINPYMFKGTS